MEKLELKHLAPYLPYGLKLRGHTHGEIAEMSEVNENNVNIKDRGFQYGWWSDIFDVSPILRPLSDLTKEIEINGEIYDGSGEFTDEQWEMYYEGLLPIENILEYHFFLELIKHHFDVFGLIEKGLAIDINTL